MGALPEGVRFASHLRSGRVLLGRSPPLLCRLGRGPQQGRRYDGVAGIQRGGFAADAGASVGADGAILGLHRARTDGSASTPGTVTETAWPKRWHDSVR